MKTLSLLVVLTFAASISLLAQDPKPKFELPELHKIKSVTLSPAYSCRPPDEFQRGYENTALYLTTQDNKRNGPDLLFNGACGSEDYFEASLSGDDMSLIADLGADVSLEEITASRAFNLRRIHTAADYTQFVKTSKVKLNHTYAVLLNESDKRGLFIFTVTGHVPNKSVDLRYAVKSYQITPGERITSSGFEWDKTNN